MPTLDKYIRLMKLCIIFIYDDKLTGFIQFKVLTVIHKLLQLTHVNFITFHAYGSFIVFSGFPYDAEEKCVFILINRLLWFIFLFLYIFYEVGKSNKTLHVKLKPTRNHKRKLPS